MDASKIWVLSELIDTNRVFFKIPVYQRNYNWQLENCQKLVFDIEEILFKKKQKHFLGTIVYLKNKSKGTTFQDLVVIDGQQRLTTLLIFLKAVQNFSCDYDLDTINGYLYNRAENVEQRIKLKSVKADREDMYFLFNNSFDKIDKERNIYKNYSFFIEKISIWIESKKINVRDILGSLEVLEIVEIVLDKDEDDAQIIFENINSTGLELSETDLIRNFLLMSAENQDELYEKYWLYIEKRLKVNDDYKILDEFFATYLKSKIGVNLNLRKLYEKFVDFYEKSSLTKEDIFKELRYFCDIFMVFIRENENYSKEINLYLQKIRELDLTTYYPFLIKVFNDYHHKIIDQGILEKVIKLIFVYLLRRKVCEIPSNSLQPLFIALYSRVFKVQANKSRYYESINKFLFTLETNDAFPTDSKFKKALLQNNLYNKKGFCQFLLSDIEATSSKELLEFENLTIEHIMPQTLNLNWKHIDLKEHKEYLNTLGNLTLTAYNSTLSNRAFIEKRDMILEKSRVLVLNEDLKDRQTWSIEDIKQRGERLSNFILNKYLIQKIEDERIHFESFEILTLDDYKRVTGAKLISFKFDFKIYKENQYNSMLVKIAMILDRKNPQILSQLATLNYNFPNSKTLLLSSNKDFLRRAFKLRDKVFIEINLSSVNILRAIDALLKEFKFDPSKFSISILKDDDFGS